MEERRKGLGEVGGNKTLPVGLQEKLCGLLLVPECQGGGDLTRMSQIPSQSALG